jgi:hypothetical protein
MVFGMSGTVGDEFSVDSNAITCHLHAVAGNGDDWFHQR